MRYEIQAFNEVTQKWNQSIHNSRIRGDGTNLEFIVDCAIEARAASKLFDGDEAILYRVVEIQETVVWEGNN